MCYYACVFRDFFGSRINCLFATSDTLPFSVHRHRVLHDGPAYGVRQVPAHFVDMHPHNDLGAIVGDAGRRYFQHKRNKSSEFQEEY